MFMHVVVVVYDHHVLSGLVCMSNGVDGMELKLVSQLHVLYFFFLIIVCVWFINVCGDNGWTEMRAGFE